MHSFYQGEERGEALHSDLHGNKIMLPVMGEELLLKFEEEKQEGEGRKTCMVHIDP